ncbi:hypothetical protein [Amycolatopsis nigrescens]|uniref:hypothetical protein n=1 Tax=Amycolatopsis nigrescens TaxID=381445 RepID=UPI0012F92B7F|nr:hypothetical protein [Amycolatopsis nigrescens]
MTTRKRSAIVACLLSLILTLTISPAAQAKPAQTAVTENVGDFVSAAQFGGPDKPLVDPQGNPVKLRAQAKPPINEVPCDGRDDFLKFTDTYQGDVCYADAGVTTNAGLKAVQSYSSGNNAGAFFYESATQCVMYGFQKWEGSYLNNLHICLIEIY